MTTDQPGRIEAGDVTGVRLTTSRTTIQAGSITAERINADPEATYVIAVVSPERNRP